MIRKKVCVLGSFAVGKTSLVQRYVKGIFSEKYLTTLGVKIDKKVIPINGQEIEFILWDLAGEDEFMSIRESYLRGSSGYFLVIDGLRNETLDTALSIKKKLQHQLSSLPFILIINKSDLKFHWTVDKEKLIELKQSGWQIIETSAKDNQGVEEAFKLLASNLLIK